jgi:hypothetical protein
MANLRSHVTYANVLATLALFLTLGGSAYAAAKLTGDDIKNRSLSAQEIKRGSLTGTEIKNRSLRAREFAAGVLVQGAKGDKGDKGDKGEKGDKGDTGGVDTTILWAVVKQDATLARGKHAVSSARLSFGGPPTTGAYLVTFDRNVSQCSYSVTEGGDTPVVSAGVSQPHQILAHPSGNGADTVLVTTAKLTGALPENVDIPFHLIVAC